MKIKILMRVSSENASKTKLNFMYFDDYYIFTSFNNIFLFQASGVTVSDICKTTYEEIKKDKKHRYVIFFIKDEKQIDVEVIGERNAEYESFLTDLQKGGTGECR